MPHCILSLLLVLLVSIYVEAAPVAVRLTKQKPIFDRRKNGILKRAAQFPFHSDEFPPRATGITLYPTGFTLSPTMFPFPRPTTLPLTESPTTILPTTSAPTTSPAVSTTFANSQTPATSLITTSVVTHSQQTTITSTQPSASPPAPPSGGSQLKISLQNTLDSDNVHVYITGVDSSNRVVMLTTAGDFYYPSASGSTPQTVTADVAIPLARLATVQLTLPDYISAARVWFADGTLTFAAVETSIGVGLVEPTVTSADDPDLDVNWGFIELTYSASYGLFANLSFVDFVGIPLGLKLSQTSGQVQSAPGLPSDAVERLCNGLESQESLDTQPWSKLCMSDTDGNPLRVLSPTSFLNQNNNSNAFSTYWTNYIDHVWSKYTTETLTINTQSAAGNVACRSDGNIITCEGDSETYSKPSAADIFGCSTGPFTIRMSDNQIHSAVVPRLCAAINRSTLDVPEGSVQPQLPPSGYYTGRTVNWYSKLVHEVELNGEGYAFPYDDVTPEIRYDSAGVVAATDPDVLTIIVGGSA